MCPDPEELLKGQPGSRLGSVKEVTWRVYAHPAWQLNFVLMFSLVALGPCFICVRAILKRLTRLLVICVCQLERNGGSTLESGAPGGRYGLGSTPESSPGHA